MESSIVDVQRALYGPNKDGPPIVPHGDDPEAVRVQRKRRLKIPPVPHRSELLSQSRQQEPIFPASELPEGFPPELAFRSLAAYSLIRTLSVQLRLSPFTPQVFLRALYLPYPNRLLGQVHVAILRFLLIQLQSGYHWGGTGGGSGPKATIPLLVTKKRKVDGLRWPLRAGDNLEFLDTYTWPLFFDDYCHLTAGSIYNSINDDIDHLDVRSLHISTVDMPGSVGEYSEQRSSRSQPSVIYMDTDDDVPPAAKVPEKEESDEEFGDDDVVEDDEDDDYEAAPKRPKKRAKTNRQTSQLPSSYASNPGPQHRQQHMPPYSRNLVKNDPTQPPGRQNLVEELNLKRARMQTTQQQLWNLFWKNQGTEPPPSPSQMPQGWTAGECPLPTENLAYLAGHKPNAYFVQTSPSRPAVAPLNGPYAAPGSLSTPALPAPPSLNVPTPEPMASVAFGSPSSAVLEVAYPAKNPLKGTMPVSVTEFRSTGVGERSPLRRSPTTETSRLEDSRNRSLKWKKRPSGVLEVSLPSKDMLGQKLDAVPITEVHVAPVAEPVPIAAPVSFVNSLDVAAPVTATISQLAILPAPAQSDIAAALSYPATIPQVAYEAAAEIEREFSDSALSVAGPSGANTTPLTKTQVSTIDVASCLRGFPASIQNIGATRVHHANLAAAPGLPVPPASPLVDSPLPPTASASYVAEKTGLEAATGAAQAPVMPPVALAAAPRLHAPPVNPSSVDSSTLPDGSAPYAAEKTGLHPAAGAAQAPVVSQVAPAAALRLSVSPINPLVVSSTLPAGSTPSVAKKTGPQPVTGSAQAQVVSQVAPAAVLRLLVPPNNPLVDSFLPPTGSAPLATEKTALQPATGAGQAPAMPPLAPAAAPRLHAPPVHPSLVGTSLPPTGSAPLAAEKTALQLATGAAQAPVMPPVGPAAAPRLHAPPINPSSADSSTLPAGSTPYGADKTGPQPVTGSAQAPVVSQVAPAAALRLSVSPINPLVDSSLPPTSRTPSVAKKSVLPPATGSAQAPVVSQVAPLAVTSTISKESSAQVAKKPRKGDIHGILSAFIQGREFNLSSDEMRVDECGDNEDSEASFSSHYLQDSDQWPQFRPLRVMRSGTPYHRLSLEEKLDGLEFLLDEMLSDPIISDEFLRREITTKSLNAPFNCVPYGSLPTEGELGNIHNEDECAVCKKEGELLCCDGCPASYHRTCLYMHKQSSVPEGLWLCPECKTVDPSKFGSLHGGRKSAVEWFTKSDVSRATALQSNAPIEEPAGFLNRIQQGCGDAEFLAVHGFVFRRQESSDSVVQRYAPGAEQKILPLNPELLKNAISAWGVEGLTQWPLMQIPLNPLRVWANPPPSRHAYSATLAVLDPSAYQNKYRKAPHLGPLRKVQEPYLSDYESLCGSAPVSLLSTLLSQGGPSFKAIVSTLRNGTSLFDPYQMIRVYVLELEKKLSKAQLLDEARGTKNVKGNIDAWACSVKKCNSIPRLAKLALKLVDTAHPRAFVESWYHVAASKSQDSLTSKASVDEAPVYFRMSSGSDTKVESLRRHWERSLSGNIPNLLAKESCRLEDWIREIRPDLAVATTYRTKRKQTKMVGAGFSKSSEPISDVSKLPLNDPTVDIPSESVNVVPKTNPAGDTEIGNVGSILQVGESTALPAEYDAGSSRGKRSRGSCRRSSDRIKTTSIGEGENAGDTAVLQLSADGSIPSLHMQKKAKMSEIAEVSRTHYMKEMRWPVAGRKIFDPIGYLPPSATKRLARNAGSVVAPFVAYPTLYEVGQVSTYHVWRKRVQSCIAFEDLLMQIRVLDSFVDSTILRKCNTQRQKISSTVVNTRHFILSTQKDLQTGMDYHLVFDSGRGKVAWLPFRDVDLAAFVQERIRRRDARVQTFELQRKELLRQEAAKEMSVHAEIQKQRMAAQAKEMAAQAEIQKQRMAAQAREMAAQAEYQKQRMAAQAEKQQAAAQAAYQKQQVEAQVAAQAAYQKQQAAAQAAAQAAYQKQQVAAQAAYQKRAAHQVYAQPVSQETHAPMMIPQPNAWQPSTAVAFGASTEREDISRSSSSKPASLKDAIESIFAHHKSETQSLLRRFNSDSNSDASIIDRQFQSLRLTSSIRLKRAMEAVGPSPSHDQLLRALKVTESEAVQAMEDVPPSLPTRAVEQSQVADSGAPQASDPTTNYSYTKAPHASRSIGYVHALQQNSPCAVQPQSVAAAPAQQIRGGRNNHHQPPYKAASSQPSHGVVQHAWSSAHTHSVPLGGHVGVSNSVVPQADAHQQKTQSSSYPQTQQPVAPPAPTWRNQSHISNGAPVQQPVASGWASQMNISNGAPIVNGGRYHGNSGVNANFQQPVAPTAPTWRNQLNISTGAPLQQATSSGWASQTNISNGAPSVDGGQYHGNDAVNRHSQASQGYQQSYPTGGQYGISAVNGSYQVAQAQGYPQHYANAATYQDTNVQTMRPQPYDPYATTGGVQQVMQPQRYDPYATSDNVQPAPAAASFQDHSTNQPLNLSAQQMQQLQVMLQQQQQQTQGYGAAANPPRSHQQQYR